MEGFPDTPQEAMERHEKQAPYSVGDALTVSYDTVRLKPRRVAVLEKEEDQLTLSWGLGKKGFKFFPAQYQDGKLLVNGKTMLIISAESQAAEREARLFSIYRACVAVGLGEQPFYWESPLDPDARRSIMTAIMQTPDLNRDYQRIQALRCLYGYNVAVFPTDFEQAGLDKPRLPDGRPIQLELMESSPDDSN